MEYLVAGLPILVVVVLLVARTPTAVAVLTAITVAVLSSGMFPVDASTAAATAAAMASITVTVAVIMFAGISLTKLQQLAGAQQALSDWLNGVANSRSRAVLIYGFTLVPLIESLIGWGMGVIVVLPLLIGAGVPKLRAIQTSLLGLLLCPWGSFSPALLLMSEITGLGLEELGTATAWSNVVVIAVLGVTIVLVNGGLAQLARMWVELAAACGAMGGVLLAVNAWVAPPLGGVLAALAGAFVLGAFARAEQLRSGHAGSRAMPVLARRGLVPYAVVLTGLGVAAVAKPILPPGVVGELAVNPAFWLVLGLGSAPFALRLPMRVAARGLAESFRVFVPSASVTILFIGFGTLIGVNGMGAKLAEGATNLGGFFILLVPLTGFLSGFVTSSNTASVAMLSDPLQSAAVRLGIEPATVLGMHTAAAGAGIMTNPSRAVLAIATAKLLPVPDAGAGDGAGDGAGAGVESESESESRLGLGRVLAPALWANAVIVALLTCAAALIAVAG